MKKNQQVVFEGRIIRLTLDTVTLPNDSTCELEIVHHPGGTAIVTIDADHRLCLLRQFRHAAGGWIWELPAGKLETGEAPLATAQRELTEEAGVEARDWQPLGKILSSPGVFTEVIHLFLARDLVEVPSQNEAHEVIEVHWFPWSEALAMAERGEIEDGKTLAGILRARPQVEAGCAVSLKQDN